MSRLVAAPPPNRVRSPTDRQFASGCSPRRFEPTQLPLASELWHTPARTFTVLMWRPHRRTHSRMLLAGIHPGTLARHAPNIFGFAIALRQLARCFLNRLLHLIRADITHVCADRPLMAKRVLEFAVTIAPEHVLERHRNLRPRSCGARDERVDVFYIEVNCHR